MKRLAAALATTVLASGCWFDDDDCIGTVTVEWPDFLRASGAVTPSCSTAGIDAVDIFLDGQPVDRRFDCLDGGATIVDVVPGQYVFTVEGIGFDGAIRYRDELTVGAGCGDLFVRAQPAAGVANLFYGNDAVGCVTDTSSPAWPSCYLLFSVFDVVANTVTATVRRDTVPESDRQLFPYPLDVVIELPEGPHVVQWMELVSAGSYAPLATACTETSFLVEGGASVVTPDIFLAGGGPACH